MRRVEGKVALITGAARGQGRAQAVRLAEEGADIIAIDLPAETGDAPYSLYEAGALDETVDLVAEAGRKAISLRTDIRDLAALEAATVEGYERFGRLDIVVANAGIGRGGMLLEMDPQTWQGMLDINLTGLFNTFRRRCRR